MPLLTKNMVLGKPLRMSAWRKVALGTWKTAGDPSIYGLMEIDVTAALAYIEDVRKNSGQRITLSHFAGKAIATTIARHPDINCIQRFGRLYPRKGVDIFFQVASDTSGTDLSGIVIRDSDKKSLTEICSEMEARVKRIRHEGDPDFKKMKKTVHGIPGFLSSYVLDFAGFFMYTLNLWTPLLGSPRDPFGSAMITNIGSLGLDLAFAPLVPYSRIPLLVALGAAKDAPVVKDGVVKVAPVVKLCATIDHRVIDGMHASHLAKTLLKIFANPEAELGKAN